MIETLQSDRLIMRPLEPGDFDALKKLHAEESFWRYGLQRAMTPDETAAFLQRVIDRYESSDQPSQHAVVERSSGALAGWAGLSEPTFLPEVLPAIEAGWRLGEAFRGKGYATEAGAAALRWGFDQLGYEQVVSIYEPDNVASGRVMDRLGFPPGFSTTHPVLGVPLEVRTLTLEAWRSRS